MRWHLLVTVVMAVMTVPAFAAPLYDVTDLGTLPGGSTSGAYAINASGQVVGVSNGTGFAQHAFLYSGGSMKDLGTLPGGTYSVAYGINDSGQVVGHGDSATSGGEDHAFLYSGGSMKDLGTLPGGTFSDALGINASGQVVGSSDSATSGGNDHAFLYSGGKKTDLGTLPGGSLSQAYAINASGQVVGESDTATRGGNWHAFLYSGGTMVDLNDCIPGYPGWVLAKAYGINDKGQICGYGADPSGNAVGFLLTPVGAPASYQPDLMLRASSSAPFTGQGVFNTTGVGQTVSETTNPGAMTPFFLRVQNKGTASDNIKITANAGNATWAVHYFSAASGGTDITSQVTGTGWIPPKLAVGASVDFRAEVTPAAGCLANAAYTLSVMATSQGDTTKKDLVKAVTTCNVVYHPDLMLRAVNSSSTPFTGQGVYNTTGVGQTLSETTNPGALTRFFLRVQNNGNASDNIKITANAGNATWAVHYFSAASGGTDITSQVTGTGWIPPKLAVGASVDFRAEVTPVASCLANASYTLSILATSGGDTTKKDLVKAVTTCNAVHKPDGMICIKGDAAYLGAGIYNATAAGQTKTANAKPGVKVTYLLRVQNNGNLAGDTFKVTGPAATGGWTVHYFNAVSGGTDITSQVTAAAGWTTPGTAVGAYRDLRVEVTPDSTVVVGASEGVKVTFTSTADATKLDAVKGVTTRD